LFLILNFGHWHLFEIWFLMLGFFMIFTKHVTSVNPINYKPK